MTSENRKQFRKFIEFGLTERETKVYMMLLTRKGFTASELQHSVDIPRSKIYEVLQKLESRGICVVRTAGKTNYYEAVEPKIAFQRIFDKYQMEIRDEVSVKKILKDELIKTLNPLFNKSKKIESPLDFIEIIYARDLIQKKFLECVRQTKNKMLTFNKGPYVCNTSRKLDEQVKEEVRLIRKGIICRNIYEEKETKTKEWFGNCKKILSLAGEYARIAKSIPVKLNVFDESKVMLPLEQTKHNKSDITVVYIKHHELALACISLFDSVWEKAKPINYKEYLKNNNTIK